MEIHTGSASSHERDGTRRGRAGEVRSRYDLAPDASRVDRLLRYGVMQAAFFDLDKTIIATSSVIALGGPLYREGLISKRTIARGSAQLVYMLVGADEERWNAWRGNARAHEGLGSRASELVREHSSK